MVKGGWTNDMVGRLVGVEVVPSLEMTSHELDEALAATHDLDQTGCIVLKHRLSHRKVEPVRTYQDFEGICPVISLCPSFILPSP